MKSGPRLNSNAAMQRKVRLTMFKKLIQWILNPQWLVAEDEGTPELMLRIRGGWMFGLYKAEVIVYHEKDFDYTRKPGKREFGESLMKYE